MYATRRNKRADRTMGLFQHRRGGGWTLVLLLAFAAPALARSVVDATGRTVEVPDRIERVIPAGPPAAVLIYTLAPEKMIGWPRVPSPAAKALLERPYPDLPELAPLMRDGKIQLEQIRAAKPDVILDYGSTSPRYVERATKIEKETGIPVLLLDGKLERTPEIYRLLGPILGAEDLRQQSCRRCRAPPRDYAPAAPVAARRTADQGLLRP